MNRPPRWLLSALAVPLALLAGYGVARVGHAPAQPAAEPVPDVAEYPSMTALRKVEQAGVAYDLTWAITGSPLVVVAPHGGAIESRTSEIAGVIAGTEHSQCQFRGKLPSGQNYPRLHVTSTNWDVEECLILIAQRRHALAVHGTSLPNKVAYVGGRDVTTGAALATALRAAGFTVVQPAPAEIAGTSVDNFVNKDADGAGVQLELTLDLRMELFPTKEGPPSTRGQAFVDAVRNVYA
ncbi:poly-gamma-glutamate hydrolase family protein [Micromonospora sp. LAH09]|uniref:poly-gamma-glutamate hydrolase family protein n=1 Tax=Micromonospora cabrerizensis TaxID=2911213 RepID=UPI001EE8C6ED|nr:poly-gamma-glutamate hydrolase family protein [Micromonospora cabrerizensis]MCG5469487.1 poly-gamma-glutamate hydrolase family protein [Micromonospora cabrerizensis]